MPKFLEALRKTEPVFSKIYKVFMVMCKLMLIADILVTSWVVLARYVTIIPAPNWGEEVILTLMAYMAVLSAALAIRKNSHIRMTSFDNYIPKKALPFLDLFSDLCVFALAIVMVVYGFAYAKRIPGFFVSLTWLPKFWQYFPVPLAGLAMIFFELERIIIDFRHMYGDFSDDARIEKECDVKIEDYGKKEAK